MSRAIHRLGYKDDYILDKPHRIGDNYAMDDICQAIKNLRMLSFYYDGHPRVVEPHTYGRDSHGHLALRGWQTRGTSKSGQLNWKLFHRAEMRGLTVLQETFSGARRGYRKGDPFFSSIYCQL